MLHVSCLERSLCFHFDLTVPPFARHPSPHATHSSPHAGQPRKRRSVLDLIVIRVPKPSLPPPPRLGVQALTVLGVDSVLVQVSPHRVCQRLRLVVMQPQQLAREISILALRRQQRSVVMQPSLPLVDSIVSLFVVVVVHVAR
eukprot:768800-Hanusia_phi.AAC.5